jgi:hypothetical protein
MYFFFYLILCMSSSFNNCPEINELMVLDLSIMIVVNSVEELLSRNFAEKKFRPMLYSLIFINSFWTIFVKYLEHFIYNSHQLWWQILYLWVCERFQW